MHFSKNIVSVFLFTGTPDISTAPCPGDLVLNSNEQCPVFACNPDDCQNGGSCGSDKTCTCNNGYTGIDCTLGKLEFQKFQSLPNLRNQQVLSFKYVQS